MKKLNLTYQKSGVNINAADKFVNFISNISSKNKGKKKFDNIGSFGSISSIPNNLKKPKIVACTDGVGTKVEIANMLNKYDLKDYIISIIFKNRDNIKVLSKIYLNNSLKLDNRNFEKIDLKNEKDYEYIVEELKITFEDYWKKNNQINTSIKLPLTLSINSKEYKKIAKLEKYLDNNNLVSDYYILHFDNENIFFKIIYNGSPKKFIIDIDKKDIELEISENFWRIK